jgi:hypothetical protein
MSGTSPAKPAGNAPAQTSISFSATKPKIAQRKRSVSRELAPPPVSPCMKGQKSMQMPKPLGI